MPARKLAFIGLLCLTWLLTPSWSSAHAFSEADATKLPPAADKDVEFVGEIKPIFARHCYDCHGPELQESGLRLDMRQRALTGGDSGKVITPGDSAASPLVIRISGIDADLTMPPDTEGLTDREVGLIRAWIDQGAVWPASPDDAPQQPEHWAFRPNQRPAVPEAERAEWIRNPIDAFVIARLNAQGIDPSSAADRHTLVRRLSLDLLGLPPTPQQLDAFVSDDSPDAYERLVDRLLASPHFGERWGRHWLDMARYADSDGYEKDRPRPNSWRWRDWVIAAINDDMPFDRFTIEQIAGDLLPDATAAQKLATAFNRQTLTNTEGGTDQEEFRVEAVFDRVETTGSVWLGLTVGCARCHSHKYDPVTQREYYKLFAFFNNGDETTAKVPISDVAVEKYRQTKARHDAGVRSLQERLETARALAAQNFDEWERHAQAGLEALQDDPVEYHPLKVMQVEGPGGVEFQQLEDGSFRVSGDNPDQAEYIVTVRLDSPDMTGLRLEVLADESLPQGGPGRARNGNFVLNELSIVRAADERFENASQVSLSLASADFSQKDWPAQAAVDGNAKTGWAVSPQLNQNHSATFLAAAPVGDEESVWLRVSLAQHHGSQHAIGRFRLAVMTGIHPASIAPNPIRDILAIAPDGRSDEQRATLHEHCANTHPTVVELEKQLAKLKANAPQEPTMAVRVISQRSTDPRKTHVLKRGDFLQPTEPVQPDTLEVLHDLETRNEVGNPDRLDLARWLVSPENPLTPRVAVNHVWRYLFGVGLVSTADDFGTRGQVPSHPKLLDWLADEYQRLGWSRKALIRLIVTSSTYRQSSVHRPKLAELDPNNRLLYRQNRFRVEAEIVRDLFLVSSGLLSRKLGGPSVFPPMPEDVAALSYANNFNWSTSKGPDRYRRGLYTFFKRTAPHPNLTTFDCPDANKSCIQRTTSNTPLQALTTLNNMVFIEVAQAMARRVLTVPRENDEQRLAYAFRLCVARPPNAAEQAEFFSLLDAAREFYGQHPDEAKTAVGTYQPQDASPVEIAAWMATVRILMNLDEFVTRE